MKRLLRTLVTTAAFAACASAAAPAQGTIAQQLAHSCSDVPRAQALDARAEAQDRKNRDGYGAFAEAARIYYSCSVRSSDPHLQALFTVAYLSDIVGAANAKGTALGASMNLLRHAESVADQLLGSDAMGGDVRTVVLRYRELIGAELQQEAALQR